MDDDRSRRDPAGRPPSEEWRRGLLGWSYAMQFWSLVGVLLTGLVLTILVATVAVPWLRVELNVRPFEEAIALLRLIFGSLAFTFFGLGAILTRYAWRIWRHAEAPPPGAIVLFDTPVVRGALARQRAAVIGFAASLLLAGSIGLSLFPNAVERAVGPPPSERSSR
jgi:hypothetical protein